MPTRGVATACPACGAALAGDQRYCLECGERQVPPSEFLRGVGAPQSSPASTPPVPPGARPAPSAASGPPRNNALTLLAGIGVLLLAMGVGVLIGRSGGSSSRPAAAPTVVTVAGAGGTSSAGEEESFSGDWPSGTKGYTVQLQTLPASGTTVSAVNQAKSAAEAKGLKSVGALKSEEFSSLPSGSYVIYSGIYHKQAEAQKALGAAKKQFPGAKVLEVSEGGASSTSGGGGSSKAPAGTGQSLNKPAPASVLENEQKSKGKSYEEKSKNLPNVVSTG